MPKVRHGHDTGVGSVSFYALEFCKLREIETNGMLLTMNCEFDEKKHVCERLNIDLKLPPGFLEKYKKVVVRSMDLCSVKRHMLHPPEFFIMTS